MKLSILVATIGRRKEDFAHLLTELFPQIEDYPKEIEVIAFWNNGEAPIGVIRQALVEEATGDYICFIDDDDRIPEWYCSEIINALGKDYVGFKVQLFENERVMPPVYHSIRYGVWSQDENGYYRGVTHLNPIKRSIALEGVFGMEGGGEDETWAWSVTPLVRTENYIDKIMYYYYHDSDDSSFTTAPRQKYTHKRPIVQHPQFRWHPLSTKEGDS